MTHEHHCPPQTKMDLADFIIRIGRVSAARMIGCTGPALLKALKAGRTISVEVADDGTIKATETKAFPGR